MQRASGITFIRCAHSKNLEKGNNLKVFGASKPNDPKRIAKIY